MHDYLTKAIALTENSQAWYEKDIPQLSLPDIDDKDLEFLLQESKNIRYKNPELSCAINYLIYQNITYGNYPTDETLKSIFNLSREFNHWGYPKKAKFFAKKGLELLDGKYPKWKHLFNWQLHALPWANNNIRHSLEVLSNSVNEINKYSKSLAVEVKLSLFYAELLTGNNIKAKNTLQECKTFYEENGEKINAIRCSIHLSSLLRRESPATLALDLLSDIEGIFDNDIYPMDVAKINHLKGVIFQSNSDYEKGKEYLTTASEQYNKLKMPVWRTQCEHAIGLILIYSGEFKEANIKLLDAKKTYLEHEVFAPVGDIYIDLGTLAKFQGNYHDALNLFISAEEEFINLNIPRQQIIAIMNQGDILDKLGSFQQAFERNEKALNFSKKQNDKWYQTICLKNISLLYAKINDLEIANDYIDQAITYQTENDNNPILLIQSYCLKSDILFAAKKYQEMDDVLTILLQDVDELKQTSPATFGYIHFLYGKLKTKQQEFDLSNKHLSIASIEFSDKGMQKNFLECQLALGTLNFEKKEFQQAITYFQKVYEESFNAYPTFRMEAAANLGFIYKLERNLQESYFWFKNAVAELEFLRKQMWQIDVLSGTSINTSTIFEETIALALQSNQPKQALEYISLTKAFSLYQQLSIGNHDRDQNNKLISLRREINEIQEKINIEFESSNTWLSISAKTAELQDSMKSKSKEINQIIAEDERTSIETNGGVTKNSQFDIEDVIALANDIYENKWVAIDYYYVFKQLYCAIVTPNGIDIESINITGKLSIKLQKLNGFRIDVDTLSYDELEILSGIIPEKVQKYLQPKTTLLISPHQILHQIPWSALVINGHHLVKSCIPTIVPSLAIFQSLQIRNKENHSNTAGLAICIEDYRGRYPNLEYINKEIEYFNKEQPSSKLLTNANATWENLLNSLENTQYSFLHIASHSFFSGINGGNSGIALYDQDIWLYQLKLLNNCPSLITLAGCSSIQHGILAGDEMLGMPSVLFASGANSVIGSLWPILDESASSIMINFHKINSNQHSPSHSLAMAQRDSIKQNNKWTEWGTYISLGI